MTGADAYIDAAAGLMGLAIAPDHRPGVRRFLGIAAEMAAVLDQVPLDDGALELAPAYLPPGRPRPDPTA